MKVTQETRNNLLEVARKKKIYLEGNLLKIIESEDEDSEFREYLEACREKDSTSRKKRLDVTKRVQSQNKELEKAAGDNKILMDDLKVALDQAEEERKKAEKSKEEAERSKSIAEKLRDDAMGDLETLQKKTQFELVGIIVKIALAVICAVAIITSILYIYVLSKGLDSKIIESTWSNLFGILLTNSFSIIGTIMGVKYATNEK
jgi:hypothetical protein